MFFLLRDWRLFLFAFHKNKWSLVLIWGFSWKPAPRFGLAVCLGWLVLENLTPWYFAWFVVGKLNFSDSHEFRNDLWGNLFWRGSFHLYLLQAAIHDCLHIVENLFGDMFVKFFERNAEPLDFLWNEYILWEFGFAKDDLSQANSLLALCFLLKNADFWLNLINFALTNKQNTLNRITFFLGLWSGCIGNIFHFIAEEILFYLL